MPAPTPVTDGSSTSTGDSTATSANWPTPGGYADGDVAVVYLTANESTTVTPPSGWTLVQSGALGTRFFAYVKKLTGAQPASHSFNFSSGTKHIVAGQLYRGADAAVDASNKATGNSTSIPMPSVTTTGPDRLVVSGIALDDPVVLTAPTGTAQRWNLQNTAGVSDITSGGADFVQAAAGATSTASWSSDSVTDWIAITVALKPSESAAPVAEAPHFVGMYGL